MNFLKSILTGNAGHYNIFGFSAKFEEAPDYDIVTFTNSNLISKMALACIESNAFRLATQGYLHVFVHEMSHALACRLFVCEKAKIQIFRQSCQGGTNLPDEVLGIEKWKKTIIDVSGPMGNIAFCICKLVAALALRSYLSWPVALALGSGAAVWMAGEVWFAFTSAIGNDSVTDFGLIANRGKAHLALASVALISECALGIFLAIRFST